MFVSAFVGQRFETLQRRKKKQLKAEDLARSHGVFGTGGVRGLQVHADDGDVNGVGMVGTVAEDGLFDREMDVDGVDGGYGNDQGQGVTDRMTDRMTRVMDQGGVDVDVPRGQGWCGDMALGGNDYAPHMPEEGDIHGDGVSNPSLPYHSHLPPSVQAMSPILTVLPPPRVHPLHLRWNDDDNDDDGGGGGEGEAWCATGINPPARGILPFPSIPPPPPSSSLARQKFEPFIPGLLPPPPHHTSVSVPIPLIIRSPSRRNTSSSSSSSSSSHHHVNAGIMPLSSSLIDRSVGVDRDESGMGLITLLPAFATKAATGTTRNNNNEEFWDSMLLS